MKAYALFIGCLVSSQGAVNAQGCFEQLGQPNNQIDDATNSKYCRVEFDKEEWDLQFSDEFETPKNLTYQSKDRAWTSLDMFFAFNQADGQCVSSDAVSIANGRLRLSVLPEAVQCARTLEEGLVDRNFSVASVESWNKFCFTGGQIEVGFSLSEQFHKGAGLYIQLIGNLYRIGKHFDLFSDYNFWDYDTCSGSTSDTIKWGRPFEQKISACTDNENAESFGLPKGRGRGAQSTIVAQVIPYQDEDQMYTCAVDHAFAVRPPSPPIYREAILELTQEGVFHNTTKAGPVVIGEEEKDTNPRYRRDSLSGAEVLDLYKAVGLHVLKPDDVHRARIHWEPGEFFRWYLNDTLIFSVNQETLAKYEYQGVKIGERLISKEAAYISMFITCPFTSPMGLTPACPVDNPEELDQMYAEVDYVRVYQRKTGERNLSCSPKDLPTEPIISSMPDVFKWPYERAVDKGFTSLEAYIDGEPKESQPDKDGTNTILWVVIVSAGVLIFLATGSVLYMRYSRRRSAALLLKQDQVASPQGRYVVARVDRSGSPVTTINSASSYQMPQNIQGLQLYEPLGAGSFGKVYRGKWKGFQVAVKVQRHMSDDSTEKIRREAELSLKMKHPNVVQTYYHSIVHRDHVEVDRLLHGSGDTTPHFRRKLVDNSSTAGNSSTTKDAEAYFTPTTAGFLHSMETAMTSTFENVQTDNPPFSGPTSTSADMFTPGSTTQLPGQQDIECVFAAGGQPGGSRTVGGTSGQAAGATAENFEAEDESPSARQSSKTHMDTDQGNLLGRGNVASGAHVGGAAGSEQGGVGSGGEDSFVGDTEARLKTSRSQDGVGPLESQEGSSQEMETWIVQELCDLGAMKPHVVRRLMFENGEPMLDVILETAMDIARGMEYLHLDKITHGDLKATNVLLQTAGGHHNQFVAKVADFGLSRVLKEQQTATKTVGTVTHMPPELLMKGVFSFKGDVYAFGIILWELAHGQYPYQGLTQGQIITKLITNNERPQFTVPVVAEYVDLTKLCWDADPAKRPTFFEVRETLERIKVHYYGRDSLYHRSNEHLSSHQLSTTSPHV